MVNAYDTEDGAVFDMSNLECEALRSYADGLLDPEHPFVELLRSQGLVVGDTPVPHLAALLQAFSQATKVLAAWVLAPAGCRRVTFFVGPHCAAVSRCDGGGLYGDEDDMVSVWAIDSAQLRDTFFELSAIGEPTGEGVLPTAVPEVLLSALEQGDGARFLVESARCWPAWNSLTCTPTRCPCWRARMAISGRLLRRHRRGRSGVILRMFYPSRLTPERRISQSENVG